VAVTGGAGEEITLGINVTSAASCAGRACGVRESCCAYAPKRGVIATGTIAKNIANIYLGEVYGAQKILAEFPLTAKLQDGVWTVEAIFRLLRMVAWQSYGSVAATEQS
jgi:hypothetical protein